MNSEAAPSPHPDDDLADTGLQDALDRLRLSSERFRTSTESLAQKLTKGSTFATSQARCATQFTATSNRQVRASEARALRSSSPDDLILAVTEQPI